jgi:hypothetical protein
LRVKKNTQVFATGSPETFRHSLRDGLTVSFVLSPEIGLCVSVVGAMREHCRQLAASVEASGPHDFAVRDTRNRLLRASRPPLPAPNVRDDRETPLVFGRGMREVLLLICPTAQRCRLRQINTTGKSGGAREKPVK